MKGQALSLMLAGWGAALSTTLAAIRVGELWRDRHRIEISYSLSTGKLRGNTIIIRNLSRRPLTLCYWELRCALPARSAADVLRCDKRIPSPQPAERLHA